MAVTDTAVIVLSKVKVQFSELHVLQIRLRLVLTNQIFIRLSLT